MEESNFSFRYVRYRDLHNPREIVKLFANSEDPDQTPHSKTSDLGLHCLPVTVLGDSRLKGVNLS